jgi:hypothetical protein
LDRCLFDQLDRGDFDIVVGGILVNLERFARASAPEPYLETTAALVLLDYRRNEIETWRQIDEELIMRLGVAGEERAREAKDRLPNPDIRSLKTSESSFSQFLCAQRVHEWIYVGFLGAHCRSGILHIRGDTAESRVLLLRSVIRRAQPGVNLLRAIGGPLLPMHSRN